MKKSDKPTRTVLVINKPTEVANRLHITMRKMSVSASKAVNSFKDFEKAAGTIELRKGRKRGISENK